MSATPNPPRRPYLLYAFAGPAWAFRERLRFALAVKADHGALVAARVARLGLLDEAGLLVWRDGGRAVKADAARLMRAVAEEVEAR